MVYVCDNDYPGEKALQEVSKHYGRTMKGIKFGDHFKHSWDMAEELPPALFKDGRWIGPQLESLKCFATFATETLPVDKGRPPVVLKDVFAQEWVHSVTPNVYVHKDWPNRIRTADEFDDDVHPFSLTNNTSRLMTGCNAIKSAEIKYDPSMKPGVYEGGRYFNTHCPGKIKAGKGDAGPWLEFMEHLLPVKEDRIEVMRWIATLIARPKIKMMYALLLISENQGVGKTTLGGRILERAAVVGASSPGPPGEPP